VILAKSTEIESEREGGIDCQSYSSIPAEGKSSPENTGDDNIMKNSRIFAVLLAGIRFMLACYILGFMFLISGIIQDTYDENR
jgi:hypothetical protein